MMEHYPLWQEPCPDCGQDDIIELNDGKGWFRWCNVCGKRVQRVTVSFDVKIRKTVFAAKEIDDPVVVAYMKKFEKQLLDDIEQALFKGSL